MGLGALVTDRQAHEVEKPIKIIIYQTFGPLTCK